MKKILVPTDFSDCAKAATEIAMLIAQKTQAEIFFLNICVVPAKIMHVPHNQASDTEFDHHEMSEAKNELYLLAQEAESRGVKATPVLVMDNGNERIENYIDPYQIDFIVMGSHGVKGIRKFLLGSNTLRLSRNIKVPLLVVKQRIPLTGFKNILFASAFQFDVKAAMNVVTALATAFNARLDILYINFLDQFVSSEEAHAKMNEVAKVYPEMNFTFNVAETNDEMWAISQFVKKLQSDLVCVTASEKVGAIKVMSSKIAEQLISHEDKPILVFHESSS